MNYILDNKVLNNIFVIKFELEIIYVTIIKIKKIKYVLNILNILSFSLALQILQFILKK